MNLFELFVKIGVDDQASQKIQDISSNLGNGLKTAAEVGLKAIGAASTGIATLAGAAVNNFAEYEQLVGGIETIFEDSADAVKTYADEAFRSAGLSANEYMSTVTGFSSSLMQSLGRGAQTDLALLEDTLDQEYLATKRSLEDQYDAVKQGWKDRIDLAKKNKQTNISELTAQRDEELKILKRSNEDQLSLLKEANKQRLADAESANQKSVVSAETQALAAEKANQAVIDMADNANKMGTSIEMIQNAYAGFSKQNYTIKFIYSPAA